MWTRLSLLHQRLVESGPGSFGERCLFLVLLPLALLFGSLAWLRSLGYDLGLRTVYASAIPVISVGNLAAGGTGKTPVVDFLTKELQQGGYSVAILSRGYGGRYKGRTACVSDGQKLLLKAAEAGDEPFLLANRNQKTPVVVARQRKYGIQYIEQTFPWVDFILLDDGFQHRAVKRECNIVLLDQRRPFGNGWPLPAGILREFSCALKRADIVIFTRADQPGDAEFLSRPAFYADYCLSDNAMSLTGELVPLASLKNLRLCAFAGIAHPDLFFNSLEKIGLKLVKLLSFNDHADYNFDILKWFEHESTAQIFITTEKDAVKLSPEMFSRPCYQVPLELRMTDKTLLIDTLLNKVHGDQ